MLVGTVHSRTIDCKFDIFIAIVVVASRTLHGGRATLELPLYSNDEYCKRRACRYHMASTMLVDSLCRLDASCQFATPTNSASLNEGSLVIRDACFGVVRCLKVVGRAVSPFYFRVYCRKLVPVDSSKRPHSSVSPRNTKHYDRGPCSPPCPPRSLLSCLPKERRDKERK